MKFIIIWYSVIGGLAQNCGNDGSGTLSSCLSNPNIRIEKIQKMGGIKSYRLSLRSWNTWWAAENEWIECQNLCTVCESLPGVSNDGENIFGQFVETFVLHINSHPPSNNRQQGKMAFTSKLFANQRSVSW